MKQTKRACPEYPIFLVETPKTGDNCSVYWVSQEFADIQFLGTIPYSNIMDDAALENLLELAIDKHLNVYLGEVVDKVVIGVKIGRLYQKGEFYWHHLFAAEKRKTASSAARAMYKMLRLHRTSIGENVLTGLQNKRNF